MNALLIAALAAILSVQSQLSITTIPAPEVTSRVVMADGSKVETVRSGYTTCATTNYPDGRKTGHVDRIVAVPESVGAETLTHEMLHGADCVDDGEMNGSLLPYKPTWADPGHEWVYWALDNQEQAIEIISCSIRPHVYLCKGE